MIEHNTQSYATPTGILAFPDHYVALAQIFAKDHSLAVVVEGRKIIKAGTIYPANDGTAIGVVFSDMDVTDGDVNGAVIVHGFISTPKMPVVPASTAIAALKGIFFLPLTTVAPTMAATLAAILVGAASGSVYQSVITLTGAKFRPEAATLSNWTFAGEATNKAAVTAIAISEDGLRATLTITLSATAVAGSTTAIPKAAALSLGVVPAAAINVATVAAA